MGILSKVFGSSGMTKVERLRARNRTSGLWKMSKKDRPGGLCCQQEVIPGAGGAH